MFDSVHLERKLSNSFIGQNIGLNRKVLREKC